MHNTSQIKCTRGKAGNKFMDKKLPDCSYDDILLLFQLIHPSVLNEETVKDEVMVNREKTTET